VNFKNTNFVVAIICSHILFALKKYFQITIIQKNRFETNVQMPQSSQQLHSPEEKSLMFCGIGTVIGCWVIGGAYPGCWTPWGGWAPLLATVTQY